jgi:hypothetical protein
LVRFTGALTLTNSASLVLPGGVNITTAAGDYAYFVGYSGGTVRCCYYSVAIPVPLGTLRNRIINGDFSVSQVNGSSAVTVTAAAALQYVIDQWYAYCTGANVTGQRVAGTGAEQYVYQFTGAASVTKIGFAQRIETSATYDMNTASAMIGVSMSNSLLTSVNYNVWYANTADTFGTLASPTRTLITSGTLTVSAAYTRQYIPVTVPAGAVTGIEIEFNVGAQISGTWKIGRLQYESVPTGATTGTAFEVLPYQKQLERSQWYYRFIGGVSFSVIIQAYGAAGTYYIYAIYFPPMRTTPYPTKVGTWSTVNCGQPNVSAMTNSSIYVATTVTGLGAFICQTSNATDGIILDARL